MRSLSFAALALAMLSLPSLASAAAIGPTPYLQASDSPLAGGAWWYFYLEDFEDGVLNTPGVAASGSGLCVAGTECFVGSAAVDSVDADDGAIDGSGQGGNSLWASQSITFEFAADVLLGFPNVVGIVWTDGSNPITFEAFDRDGVSLGTIVGDHADGSILGQTAEDRFYGWYGGLVGISRITISNQSGIEVDHLQYGVGTLDGPPPPQVPESGTLALLGLGLAGLGLSRRRPLN